MHWIGRNGPLASLLVLICLALAALPGCGGDGAGGAAAGGDGIPQRIVSLSPTATEDLFAIGAGEQVIAVDDQSNFPPRAPRTELSGFQPSVEAVASYRPDLVVAAGEGTAAAVRGLRKLGVKVVVQEAAGSLPDAYAQIEELGRLTGHAEQSRRVVAEMRAGIASAIEGAPSARGLTVFHELSPDYFSAASDTFIGRLYRLFGLANIADEAAAAAGTPYPQLSSEHIVAADPDLIVLADVKCCGQSPATVRRRAGWDEIAALDGGGVVAIDDDIASRWGPRVPRFAARLAAAIEAVREG
jgi:ABC-type Fe3+-hydroxamate transport system substrate-binding protein